jgi:tRNA (guanine37-N1)-methyltransferase
MVPRQSSVKGPSSKSSSRLRPLEFHFLTLFPEVFTPFLSASIVGKAQERGLAKFNLVQIRDFSKDKHHSVDDKPYGGGDGMLLKADVLFDAWKSVVPRKPTAKSRTKTILLSPQGQPFNQDMAKELATYKKLVFVCGHYEGVDERFIDLCVDQEVSVGDYVLTGGELPALVMADAITRLVPGVVGKQGSVTGDSLEGNLLKYPQYTRPREFKGLSVPDVLLAGDHKAIARWREAQAHERTARKRPDLWAQVVESLERSRGR